MRASSYSASFSRSSLDGPVRAVTSTLRKRGRTGFRRLRARVADAARASPRSAARSCARRAARLLSVLHEHESGYDIDLEALGEIGIRVDVDAADAQALALLPLEWASRLSIRRAGPERSDQKNTSSGRSASVTESLLLGETMIQSLVVCPENSASKLPTWAVDGRLVHDRPRARARRRARRALRGPALGNAARPRSRRSFSAAPQAHWPAP